VAGLEPEGLISRLIRREASLQNLQNPCGHPRPTIQDVLVPLGKDYGAIAPRLPRLHLICADLEEYLPLGAPEEAGPASSHPGARLPQHGPPRRQRVASDVKRGTASSNLGTWNSIVFCGLDGRAKWLLRANISGGQWRWSAQVVTSWRIMQPHPIHTVTEALRGRHATIKLDRPRSPLAVRRPDKKAHLAGGVASLGRDLHVQR
jgi:hypothetical protein